MIRLKIIKTHKKYKVGQTVYVTPNEAHGLVESGFAEQTKDFTVTDYRAKNDGRHTGSRTNRRSKR